MYSWTDEQKKAIEAFGTPVIVSAAAGSGKTAVLVERTVSILCDESKNIPADSLLAVTFTNDAAAQMCEKLSAEIDLRADKEPENAWIQRQQALLKLAEIETINSFCFGMVKDNLSETDFQSGVRIIEENEAGMMTDRALTEVLEREYAERPENMEDLISVFCRENDSNLRRLILQLYRFLRTLPFKDVWISKTLRSFRDGSFGEEILNTLNKKISEKRKSLLELSRQLERLADMLEYHSAVKSAMKENAATAKAAIDCTRELDFSEILDISKNITWRALTGRQKKEEKELQSETELSIYESAKELNTQLKDEFKELSRLCLISKEDIISEAEMNADYLEKLFDICKKLEDEVYEKKVEKNALDFSDTELLTVKLLIDCDENGRLERTPLCKEIVGSGRFKIILIDEFQDVNDLQEVIFKAISDTEDLSEIGKNVFAVGDMKQAIYRFRQANPMIFTRTRERGKNPDSPVRELLLRKNFRSRGAVLDFCNYIFSSLMSESLGETEYTDEEKLFLGSDYITPDKPVEIILTESGDEDINEVEFIAAARKIRRMIDEKEQVKDGEGFRCCRPSDFCILTRKNVAASDITEIFAAEGLKVLSSEASGYLKSREISLLLNLLAIISNPMQDVPLASVMLSPILGFTDDEIASLRLLSSDSRLYKIVLGVTSGDYPAEEELFKKCLETESLIKRLGVYSSGMTLTRLIRKIYDVTDIFSLASSYEDAEQKCANLYLLLEYARSYEQSSPDGAAGFLRFIDYISESGGDFEQALSVTETGDAVAVKTIHRSKGLEYPFVILCQTGRTFNRTDLNGALQLSSEHGAGLRFLDYSTLTKRPTAFWEYIREINNSEMMSEELRLLYVALTRAKERLIIMLEMSEKNIKRAESFSYSIQSHRVPAETAKKADCVSDWLLMALLKHPGFTALRSKLSAAPYADRSELPDIKVSPMPKKSDISLSSDAVISKPVPGLAEDLIRIFSQKTDSRLTETEAKLTVSEIVKDDALSFFPQVPGLDESLEEFSAAKKGTLTHRFMQYCDFDLAKADCEKEIKRLTDLGIFTHHESEAIERKSVEGFFASEIYKRLEKSGNILRERRFIVKFDDIETEKELNELYNGTDGMLQGVADCLFEEPDGYVLVDYKTDRVKTVNELSERYALQISLYKAAFAAILDKPIKCGYIYSFRLGEGIEISC